MDAMFNLRVMIIVNTLLYFLVNFLFWLRVGVCSSNSYIDRDGFF